MNNLSDKKSLRQLNASKNDTLLSIGEASTFAGVSTRTIERHAIITKYQPIITVKNGKKLKCYEVSWLSDRFQNVVSEPTEAPENTEKQHSTSSKKEKNVVSDSFLKEHISFLTKEIDKKNEQLQAKDSQILELISSEQKTKMLLADLQLQQKNLLLNEPTARQKGKKESRIWWALFVLLVAVCGGIMYFGVGFIQQMIDKFTNN